jgi:NAD(P) transhydrogenase subunit alpha
VAATPDAVRKLVAMRHEVSVQSSAGLAAGHDDDAYRAAGATVATADEVWGCDVVMKVRPPSLDEAARLREGAVLISLLQPERHPGLLDALAARKATALALERIPRVTRAQKMDVLSSQASLAGYAAVILGAERLDRVFPMMMTPSGTIAAAKVFIIGAGVAGLQAIATAKRLGAKVEAFDTRPAVEEQVQSLGAKFVKVDLGETGQTEQGYAKALTEEQLAKQREVMAKQVAQSDVVITTAQDFGRPAPRILTTAMVEAMRPGSVVIDIAAATGGNVEGSEPGVEKKVGLGSASLR